MAARACTLKLCANGRAGGELGRRTAAWGRAARPRPSTVRPAVVEPRGPAAFRADSAANSAPVLLARDDAMQLEIFACSDVRSAATQEEWDLVAGASTNPFLSHAFLSSAEDSGCAAAGNGWQPVHLLARKVEGGHLVGAVPCYIKAHRCVWALSLSTGPQAAGEKHARSFQPWDARSVGAGVQPTLHFFLSRAVTASTSSIRAGPARTIARGARTIPRCANVCCRGGGRGEGRGVVLGCGACG